ncbi:hypothetical protein ACE1TH_12995 [Shouchella sp. JSM 1781072]
MLIIIIAYYEETVQNKKQIKLALFITGLALWLGSWLYMLVQILRVY